MEAKTYNVWRSVVWPIFGVMTKKNSKKNLETKIVKKPDTNTQPTHTEDFSENFRSLQRPKFFDGNLLLLLPSSNFGSAEAG